MKTRFSWLQPHWGLDTSVRLFSILTLVFCVTLAVLPTVAYFYWARNIETSSLHTEALLNARAVQSFAETEPEHWVRQTEHLQELFEPEDDVDGDEESRTLYDHQGGLVLQQDAELDQPLISETQTITLDGKVIGKITLTRSIYHVWLHTLGVGLAFLSCAGLLLFFIHGVLLRALRQAVNELRNEKEKALITLQAIGDAVLTTDALLRVEGLNPVAEKLTGWRTEQAQGQHLDEVFKIGQTGGRLPTLNPIRECLQTKRVVKRENNTLLLQRGDGQVFNVDASAAPILQPHGDLIGAVMVFHDVTESQRMHQLLEHTALHDALTGLANRELFRKRITKAIQTSRDDNTSMAVLFLDLDRFKSINDRFGHNVGDELLVLVAKRLCQCVRENDTVCRMGGDEFTAVLSDVQAKSNVETIAQKILAALDQPFNLHGQHLSISTSIGVALFPQDGDEQDELIKHADTAMYHAKKMGRNNVQFYTTVQQQEAPPETER